MLPYLIYPASSGIYKMYLQVRISGQMIQQAGVTLPQNIQEIPVIGKVGYFIVLLLLILVYYRSQWSLALKHL
jgi:hypothetical protein